MHYAVLLLCQSECTMKSCCNAKVYALCSLVAAPMCMQSCWCAKVYALCSLVAEPKCMYCAVLLQCQSVCTMQSCCSAKVYMQICCSAKVYTVLLPCQSVYRLVAVPKCMHICCSAGEPAIFATRSVAISAISADRSQTTFAAPRIANTTARGEHFLWASLN